MNNKNSDTSNLARNIFPQVAPKTWGFVASILPPDVLKSVETDPNFRHPITELFRFLCQSSRLELPAIRREEGVSFNPRPARLIEILIRENGASTKSLTLLGMLEGALLAVSWDPPAANGGQDYKYDQQAAEPPTASMPHIHEMAKLVHKFESDHGCQVPEPRDGALAILLARSLDTLRHCHLDGISPSFRQSQIVLAERLLGFSALADSHPRLFTLVEAALNRLKRRLK